MWRPCPICVFAAALLAGNCYAADTVKMATTTSVENSGLLDELLPAFEKETGIKAHAVSVGTGKALKLAENGDVDLVLVHAPKLEKEFLGRGLGIERTPIFYNDFVIAGPADDPAGIRNAKDAAGAFKKIAEKQSVFVSRADSSGTHHKELEIWNKAGISPEGPRYLETGQGMGAAIIIADEKRAYCLIDRATFISYEDKISLSAIYEKDPSLINEYSLIAVNPAVNPHVKYNRAKAFIDWSGSLRARRLINGFRKRGQSLFRTY